MTTSSDSGSIRAALGKLGANGAQRVEWKVESQLPGREQRVEITYCEKTGLVATTSIADDLSDQVRSKLLRWTATYPFVTFRMAEDVLNARIQFDATIEVDEQVEMIRYLARLADRLEYELCAGEDSF